MAVCGPGLLGGSEAITILRYGSAHKNSVKRYKLLALISLLTWLASILFTCLMTDVVSVALERNNQEA